MDFVIGLSLAIVAIYLINYYFLNYWKRRGFPQSNPTFLIGNCGKLFKFKTCFAEFLADFYNRKQKVVGIYLFYTPAVIINDPVIVQQILIKDFGNFHDRPMPVNEDVDPISGNLFFIKGQKWRELRVKFTPLFTSGKLKVMFPVMRECGDVLQNYITKNVENGNNVLDFKDLLARFTINIISSVGFGVEIDCISQKDHIFRKRGLEIFTGSLRRGFINFFLLFWPNLMEKLKVRFSTKEIDEFFSTLVTQTVEYREKNNVHRNDFMDLMIQMKNFGYVSADKDEKAEKLNANGSNKISKLTMNEIFAQAFIFFAAGFETSSSTMTFCLFELCKNLDLQRKVQDEIDEVLENSGDEGMTYEALQKMKYLDCCIDETLRKYPVVFVSRTATKTTNLPTTDLIVEKGTTIYIPLLGIQRDPEIYENPLEFKPERFLNSATGSPNLKTGLSYLPFGDGQRNCIGARMGKIQTKLGIVLVLRKFNLELDDPKMADQELKYDVHSGVMSPREKMNLKISAR